MADKEERKNIEPESEEALRKGITPTGGRQFGMMPGQKDPTAARAAEREREPVLRGASPDQDNPTPPGDVGTGQIGLGPAEPPPDKVVDTRAEEE